MAMAVQVVGAGILGLFTIERTQLWAATRSANASNGIDDHIRPNQPSGQRREQRQDRGRGVAARVSDERTGRDAFAIPFTQTIDAGFQQGRCRVSMLLPLLLDSRLVQAEIS